MAKTVGIGIERIVDLQIADLRGLDAAADELVVRWTGLRAETGEQVAA
jgi:hypothetical protein